MTDQSPPISSAQEFLRLRHAIVDNTDLLEKFDDQLRDMCTQQPDEAAHILSALAEDDRVDGREAAAIYVRHLLPTRYDTAYALLRNLLHDHDEHIRTTTEDTVTAAVNAGTITIADAARLHASKPDTNTR